MGAGQSAESLLRQYGLVDVPGDPTQRTPEQEARVQRAKRDVLAWSTPAQGIGAKANEFMERTRQRQLESQEMAARRAIFSDSAGRATRAEAVRTNFANQFADTELHGGGDLLQAGSFVAFAFPSAPDSRDRDGAKRQRADRLLYLSADDFSALQRYCETATVLLGADVGISDTRQRMLAAGQTDDAPPERDEHGNAVVRLPALATRRMTYEGLRDLVELARFGEVQTMFPTRLRDTAHFLMCPSLRPEVLRAPLYVEQLTTETLWLTDAEHRAAEVRLLRDVVAYITRADHRQTNILLLLVADLSDQGRPAIAVCAQEIHSVDDASYDLTPRVYHAGIPLPATTDPLQRWDAPFSTEAVDGADAGETLALVDAVRVEAARREREAHKTAGGSRAVARSVPTRRLGGRAPGPLMVRAIGDQRGDPVATYLAAVEPLDTDIGTETDVLTSVAYATNGKAVAVAQQRADGSMRQLVTGDENRIHPLIVREFTSIPHGVSSMPYDMQTAVSGAVWTVGKAPGEWVVGRVSRGLGPQYHVKLPRTDHTAHHVSTAVHPSGVMAVIIFGAVTGTRTAVQVMAYPRDGELVAEDLALPIEHDAAVVDALFVDDLLVLLSVVGGDRLSVTTGFVAPVKGRLARFAPKMAQG